APATAEALEDLDITDTVVLGGTAAVSDAVMAALPDPVRLSGADRAGTGVAVAQQLWGSSATESVPAHGYDDRAGAWALAAAPLAARRGAPLLVTTGASVAPATAAYLAGTPALRGGMVVGSTGLLAPDVAYAASDLIRR